MGDQPMPEWLTKDFFSECLQKKQERQDITVTNFTTSSAAPPGNNYGSFILRVKVEYKKGDDPQLHSLSLIVKSEHYNGAMKELTDKFQMGDMKLIEPSFYYTYTPEANKFTDTSLFIPSTFFSGRPNVTVLEDLKEQGFVMADRLKQLDFDHCSMYMKAAAKFHSVSVPVYKDHPELLKPLSKVVCMFLSDSTIRVPVEIMTTGGITCFIDAIEKVDGYKKYSGSIRSVIPDLYTMYGEVNKTCKYVNTVRQGDPWTTNMMFKYDGEGMVCDIKLIDFQALSYGSPVSDLLFFIWSSATNDVKQFKSEELYKIYTEEFNKNLEQFNCSERMTYEQLKLEVRRLTPYILFLATCLVPIFRDPEPTDMVKMFSSTDVAQSVNFFEKYYNEGYCTEYLPHLLKCLESTGVFDYFEKRKKKD